MKSDELASFCRSQPRETGSVHTEAVRWNCRSRHYAILGMRQGHVEIWNPWGYKYHFEPKGRPGRRQGYFVESGKFSVPMHDFVQIFGTVNIETDQVAHHNKK